ncbi:MULTISPECIES: H-NS family nucleoid-associated regulatory protein [Gemmobacter]|jgi:DNA-binding protein H-NS|uniref:DNA-binding protein H-NS n=2 Tax=Gemmobacter TaxID=204456 RepID=A0A2T6B3E7_9RHOB|nr:MULTISPECIES: H-NS histone family protein [Gemmobacter]OJY27976.1 MAG: transcriptional regulator [Rhodobacterales bacterium 65-51]PTX50562.1 DNA-binding protein H-NS [Gemmobacter caeni]TWI94700.1 DNA-binding protein H-NS [Gemmobacter caeni]GHC38974.1 trans-acting regulatory protein hvrA [Gemmobacter nanjingensis]
MTEINLDAFSLSELKQLEKSVAKAIASFEDRRKAEARAKVDELARELGYSFEALAEAATARKRAPAAAKYRHPENADLTWSGRGRKPRWINEALEAGKSLDSMLA